MAKDRSRGQPLFAVQDTCTHLLVEHSRGLLLLLCLRLLLLLRSVLAGGTLGLGCLLLRLHALLGQRLLLCRVLWLDLLRVLLVRLLRASPQQTNERKHAVTDGRNDVRGGLRNKAGAIFARMVKEETHTYHAPHTEHSDQGIFAKGLRGPRGACERVQKLHYRAHEQQLYHFRSHHKGSLYTSRPGSVRRFAYFCS